MQPLTIVEALNVADDRHPRGVTRGERFAMDSSFFSVEKKLSAHALS